MNKLTAEQIIALKQLSSEQIKVFVSSFTKTEIKHKENIRKHSIFNRIVNMLNMINPPKTNSGIRYYKLRWNPAYQSRISFITKIQKLDGIGIKYVILHTFCSAPFASRFVCKNKTCSGSTGSNISPETKIVLKRVMEYQKFINRYKTFSNLIKIKKFNDLTKKEQEGLLERNKLIKFFDQLENAYVLTINQTILLDSMVRNGII